MAHQPTYLVGQDPFLNQSLNPVNDEIYSNGPSNDPVFQPYESHYQQSLSESDSYEHFSPGQDHPSPFSGSTQTELSQVSSLHYGANMNNLQVFFLPQHLPGADGHSPSTQPKARRKRTRSTKSSGPKTSNRSWRQEEVTALINRVKSFARGTRDWPMIINAHNHAHYGHDKARYRTEAACRKKFHDHDKSRSGKPTRTYPANRASKGQGKRGKQGAQVEVTSEQTSNRAKTLKREEATASGEDVVPAAAGANIAQPSLRFTPGYAHGDGRMQTSDYFFFDAGAYESATGPAPYPMGGFLI